MGQLGRSLLLCCLLVWWIGISSAQEAVYFLESPLNLTSSLGKDVKFSCSVRAVGEPPELSWLRDGMALEFADSNQVQVPLDDEEWMATSELSIPTVQLSDMGNYQCVALVNGSEVLSDEAYLQLEGLPFFTDEPQDLEITANTPFNLSCNAQGPPEPVLVIWLQDSVPLNSLADPLAQTPSVLVMKGLNHSASFSCEANNAKGVSTSRTAAVKVIPGRPRNLSLVHRSDHSLEVSWEPGASGAYALELCTIQAVRSNEDLSTVSDRELYNQNLRVPPFSHTLKDLSPFTMYHVRVSCRSREGNSPWTHWVAMETLEGGENLPEALPVGISTPAFSWHWWYVVIAIATTVAAATFITIFFARMRRKETRYGEAFEPSMEQGELVVHYRVRKSYSRRTTEAT
ncbi:hypothetical protein JD844_005859 [Phrynosoma platyrhinos]|uniref:Uncharacterized protein n=1 Tax=Phrynosoma platyrhinos TaxID=52577 RepID=A0ABQ7TNX9_PHRPL|nr:hypothetical protein JD844_005859 [Phrynosoma platyrhinos]